MSAAFDKKIELTPEDKQIIADAFDVATRQARTHSVVYAVRLSEIMIKLGIVNTQEEK